MQYSKKHSNFCMTYIMRLIKLIILGTVGVWYKIRAWKAETNIILNCIGGLKKSVKRKKLISHKSEMKGIKRHIL